MSLFWLIVVFSLLGSVAAVAGVAALLVVGGVLRQRLVPHLVSYSVGTLLAAAFLGLLPKALDQAANTPVLSTALAGVVGFFVLEKWLLWRHCHEEACEVHAAAGTLILVGDAFHNFVDGFAIAAAFLVSVPLGLSTSLAVIAHEVPQELGDFAILLESGYGRKQALLYNLLSSVATLPGALIAYAALGATKGAMPYILAVSAASFIYIAAADLIPALHRQPAAGTGLRQLALVLAGITTVVLVGRLAHP